MTSFTTFVFTPAGQMDATLAICASRAGAVGILNGELSTDLQALQAALETLAQSAHAPFGVKLDAYSEALRATLVAYAERGMRWVVLDAELLDDCETLISQLRGRNVKVLLEVKTADWNDSALTPWADGLVLKGNEAGGFVGEDSSFILLQKWLPRTRLPLYVRGGMTPHVAAACAAARVAGGVLDSQLLLMDEVRLPSALRVLVGNLSGTETQAVGTGEAGEYFRLLVRPPLTAARQFAAACDSLGYDELRTRVVDNTHWQDAARALLPIGQDVAFAAPWSRRFGTVGAVLRAIDAAVLGHGATAHRCASIAAGAPLALAIKSRFPIIQGPMTRVSDTAEFALSVAAGGALPMIAFAVMKGRPLEALLERTAALLGEGSWGIGLLGFAPQELLDEQLAIAARFAPDFAIIAGGRPDQAVQLERAGVPTFLHVPAANLIPTFLQEGARRFIFEGRECGGHIGPLSSFVLWSSIVDRLLAELVPCKVRADEIEIVFAGGIHDAISSAMLQVLTAPLAAAGAKVGILMGSAYLFTREIVSSGSVVEQYQREVIDCDRTVNLESGVGHASRCAYSPFARDFFRQRASLRRSGVPADEGRRLLDELILGRLRIASKGRKREGADGALRLLEPAQQREEGMYMLGQVATLRDRVTDIETLHREVTADAAALIDEFQQRVAAPASGVEAAPADIAIIGIACVLPKANTHHDYWENILAKLDAITEIPLHRWDWRLYFDANRETKDKIYSKWGGFLDDLAFDPMQYGMPPKSIKAVDPMQLMGLEVAHRTLVDAGYHAKPFDRERASVIIGASGGIGDIGMQYGLRSELPRFSGELPKELADRLPEWTEDSFAGILPNVAAGRIANRLNFGGMNLTTDAACASSLAAVYQAVTELVAGRSDFVIAGGLDTVQGPFGYLCFSKTQALSPHGRCATFDTGGDGIVISEGIAMLALKRRADAERDGDRIYGVIKGVGASSDGSAKGMTAPLPAGQLRAMRRAYTMAGFGPETVGLFEAHGTGTVAGDTAELESTTRLIAEQGGGPRQAVIGSVKTMIGHTKATAGAAGLVKAVLALHHRVLPPHSNVKTPNAVLADPKSPLYLLDEPMPWLANGTQPRRAACSAFGFGGTNFHVVLEEYSGEYREWLRPAASNAWTAELCVWSDTEAAGLLGRLTAFGAAIGGADSLNLRDAAASLAARWRPRTHTLAIVARHDRDLRTKLAAAVAFLRGEAKQLPPGVFHGSAATPTGKIALLFSGQGSQYPHMGREVALHFPAFSETLTQADAALASAFAARFGEAAALSRFIFPRGTYDEAAQNQAKQQLASTDVAQPALGAVAVGLYRLITSLGLVADMAAGHSYGEFVALHAAGAIDFDALMQLSAARGRFIVDAAGAQGAELGTMAAVNAAREVVESSIAGIDGVVLANHNAPQQSVISGSFAGVRAAAEKLRRADIEVIEIPVAAAFHSPLVRPAQQALSDLIDATPWRPTTMPVYSNSTATPHSAELSAVKKQMAEHLVQPVEFVAEVQAMYADGARIFVEIGPKSVLSRLVAKILDKQAHVAISLDDGRGLGGLLGGIGQLLCAGVPLEIASLFAGRDCRVTDPSQPGALTRTATVSKHAWLLNGSGARRYTEPVQQIGVTHEQAQSLASARQLSSPGVAAATPRTEVRPAAAESRASFAPVPMSAWKKDRPMDERRKGDSAVISEYFETMRQFLETQERVMSAYLGDGGAMRAAPRSRLVPMGVPRAAELAAAPTIVPTARPHVPVPAATPATAPVAAPAPVAARTPAPVAAAVAPPPATPAAAPAAALAPKTNGAGLTREKLLEALLTIVEEKTGYPRDMLGLDQNLEADLGIDSIKRVEVIAALLNQLPDSHREALTEDRGKLHARSTLNAMLDFVMQAAPGGSARPFEAAGTGVKADVVSHPSRLVMRSLREPLLPSMGRRLATGRFVLTRDSTGVADAFAALLRARGIEVLEVDVAVLAVESRLLEWCAQLGAAEIGGIVHLAALGAGPLAAEDGPAQWRRALQIQEKAFFLLIRECYGRLATDAHVVAASGFGGLFGRDGSSSGELQLQGGAPGTLKSLHEERPELRVKAIDLDLQRDRAMLAADLLGEVELDGGRHEVGYPGGQRTIFATVEEAVTVDAERNAALGNLVVLATGGARGITAEILRELAYPGNTLILTGRSLLPKTEDEDTAALNDANALRRHFVAQVRAGTLQLTPGAVQRRVQTLLDMREIRANLADFAAAGAAVEYHSVDVTDESALGSLIADLRQRHRRIDGVVHGAGVIEDKLLVDKQSDSWSRVIETKVIGLLLLQKLLDPATLKFFTVFSSVAGRYGNSGQSDYATANELMNRLCVALQARWGERTAVSALCWGPWGPTKFGAGMVTPETEAKFEKRGVYLVTAELGRRLFREEIARAGGTPVEVICGRGPWESEEMRRGVLRSVAAAAAPIDAPARAGDADPAGDKERAGDAELGNLLGRAEISTGPTGTKTLTARLDVSRHPYLRDGSADRHQALPATVALELMAEAARTVWPRWCVAEVRELRIMDPVEIVDNFCELHVHISPPPYGSSQGFDVSVAIKGKSAAGRPLAHADCVIGMALSLPTAAATTRAIHDERLLAVGTVYGEFLARVARLQVLEGVVGLSPEGAAGLARSTRPAQWLSLAPGDDRHWLFDPALLDAAAQVAALWSRAYRDSTTTETRFGRVVRHRHPLPAHVQFEFTRTDSPASGVVRGSMVFSDASGQAVLSIEDLEAGPVDASLRAGGDTAAAEIFSA